MKKLIISMIFMFPVIAQASGNTLKQTCAQKGNKYQENVTVVALLSTETSFDRVRYISGIEVKERNNSNSVSYLIRENEYFLYNLAKSAFATSQKVNICVSYSSLDTAFSTLYGIEMKSE